MNPAEFLYSYAKEYFQYNIKATLMIENWTDKDGSSKYHQFMKDYINLTNLFTANKTLDNKFEQILNKAKELRLNHAYDLLFNDMINRLKSKKGNVSFSKQGSLEARLKKYRTMNDTDFKYVQELRKIEEEEY